MIHRWHGLPSDGIPQRLKDISFTFTLKITFSVIICTETRSEAEERNSGKKTSGSPSELLLCPRNEPTEAVGASNKDASWVPPGTHNRFVKPPWTC